MFSDKIINCSFLSHYLQDEDNSLFMTYKPIRNSKAYKLYMLSDFCGKLDHLMFFYSLLFPPTLSSPNFPDPMTDGMA